MPWEFQGRCSDCGHEWDGIESYYQAGDIDLQNPETYRSYFCPKCCNHLSVPRLIDGNSWRRWFAAHGADMRNSALLKFTCARISAILSGSRTIYAPTAIDIEPLSCTYCNERMAPGSIDKSPIVCPNCGSRTARSLGSHVHVILAPESDIPPLAEEP